MAEQYIARRIFRHLGRVYRPGEIWLPTGHRSDVRILRRGRLVVPAPENAPEPEPAPEPAPEPEPAAAAPPAPKRRKA